MKTIIKLILCSVLFLTTAFVQSQSFDGNWDGYLKVYVNGEEGQLAFRMVIITDGNGNCHGRSALAINYDGKAYQANYDFTGTYSGSKLTFKDVKLVESTSPPVSDFYWCEKSGTLYLSGTSLSGDVSGYSPRGGCMPATAYLTWHSKVE